MIVLYFAYGSCMSPEDLGRDVSEFHFVSPAIVRGFRLGFTRYSRARKGGVADLVPDLESEVEGVLYRLPVTQLSALDEREGAPNNYRRDFIAVRTPDGKMYDRVLTYVVADKSPVDIPPHPDYALTIFSGAEAYLSPNYVKEMKKFVEALMNSPQGKGQRQPTKDSRETSRGRTRDGAMSSSEKKAERHNRRRRHGRLRRVFR